jgi:Domain of unknown function DUF11/PASTA domain
MGRIRLVILGVVVVGVFGVTSSAAAVTLGTTTFPSGATASACTAGAFYVESATDSAYEYAVPSGGGQINSWSTDTTGATPGTPLTFVVLRPSGGSFVVVGFDNETLPNPLPAIATFNIASPIPVSGGDLLGLYSSATPANCFFGGGPITPAETISGSNTVGPPSVGTTYAPTATATSLLVNVSANLVQSQDAGMAGSATPASITTGGVSEYAFTVSNGGIGAGPITFTDGIPSGLKILSAVAASGNCSTAGQTVSCTITNLGAGSSAPVSIVVSAPTAGVYADTATVSTVLTDPNLANNTASATITVHSPTVVPLAQPPKCRVVRLTGAPLAVAKIVIPALNCKVGKITKKTSKAVPKGDVISTSPGPRAVRKKGTAVKIVVSSGRPKKKRKKH